MTRALTPVVGNDRMVDALTLDVACRHCASPLRQVNTGAADGVLSSWVGSCVACRRHYVVTAEIVRVPSRGPMESHGERKKP